MRTILITILTILVYPTFGQGKTTEENLLEIIEICLAEKKLPQDLINNIDSLHYSTALVVIETTDENKLKLNSTLKTDKFEIWVWGNSSMFEFDVYWLTPSKIKINDKQTSFDFRTNTWGDKKTKYYKGTIKAQKQNGGWTIISSKMTETKNSFDPWKHYEQQKKKDGQK